MQLYTVQRTHWLRGDMMVMAWPTTREGESGFVGVLAALPGSLVFREPDNEQRSLVKRDTKFLGPRSNYSARLARPTAPWGRTQVTLDKGCRWSIISPNIMAGSAHSEANTSDTYYCVSHTYLLTYRVLVLSCNESSWFLVELLATRLLC